MKRVVITGATSMIGVALINECIRNNIEVVAIVRKSSSRIGRLPCSDLLRVVESDLSSLSTIDLSGFSYDVFYHFAWDGTVRGPREDVLLQWNNLKYTMDAVELAHRIGCRAFIGAGSQAEYGIYTKKIYANMAVNPITPYGVAKYAAGKLSASYCEKYGMRSIWGRIFSTYGINDNSETMIQYALRQFRAGKPAQFSAATQKWNYLYEADAGKIFYLLGEKNVPSGTYCVASEDTRPLKDFILEMQQVYGNDAQCIFAPPSNEKMVSLDPDITSLVEAIGWRPQTSFAEGIRKIIENIS